MHAHLKYCIPSWSHYLAKDIDLLKGSSIVFSIIARAQRVCMLGVGVKSVVRFQNVGLSYCTCT